MNVEQTSVAVMIRELGVSIAEAQYRMDLVSIEIAQRLGSSDALVKIGDTEKSLLELGFVPTFYQLTEATVEAKVSFSAAKSESFGGQISASGGFMFFAASVSASYSQKYSYSATGSSSITARFVSLPPPTVLSEVIRSSLKKDSQGEG